MVIQCPINNQSFMLIKQIFSHRLNLLCKRVILAFSLVFLLGNLSYSQTWTPVGLGTNSPIYAMTVYKGEMYVGGTFTEAGGKTANLVAKWDGKTWEAVGIGFDKIVHTLEVYDDQLYAGGEFNRADNKPAYRIAKWDGSSWSALGSGVEGNDVYSISISGNNVYAGGDFLYAGGITAKRIAKWDGTSWSVLGSGIGGPTNNIYVFSIAINGNDVYAGGGFTIAGGKNAKGIAKWNGSEWNGF